MTTSDHAPNEYRDIPDPERFTTLSDYQRLAPRTAIYPGAGTSSLLAVAYCALGLANEAGEAAGKVKKVLRDHPNVKNFHELPPELREAIADEVGDVLWYATLLLREMGLTLLGSARRNIAKLYSRQERGTIQGSGDSR